MGLLDDHVFPRINDFSLGAAVAPLRAELVGEARGRVLEIGAGTGLNFRHYRPGAEVWAVEPAEAMRRRAVGRVLGAEVPVTVAAGDARSLPFPDGFFDVVLATFVLCSVKDLDRTLAELGRVLAPGGALRVLEHVESPEPGTRAWQWRLRPLWMRVLGGCDPTRDVRGALQRAGFSTEGLRAVELPLPRLARAGLTGAAVRG